MTLKAYLYTLFPGPLLCAVVGYNKNVTTCTALYRPAMAFLEKPHGTADRMG